MNDYQLPAGKVLVLKSVNADMTAHDGFKYPESGYVEAPDWKPTEKYGNGLHGWLWGVGDFSLKVKDHDAKWLVIEVDGSDVVALDRKVKFRCGHVVFCGAWVGAWLRVRASAPSSSQNFATGDYGHASATGESGHASATGYHATACCLGLDGQATTGKHGSIILTYMDNNNRRRHLIGYVGEGGIEANATYVVQNGKLVKLDPK